MFSWRDLTSYYSDGGFGSRYAAAVLADSPDAYYRKGELAGSVLVDTQGAHNGVYVGAPSLGNPGAVNDGNTAVVYDGTINQYARVAAYTTIPAAPVSLECWARLIGVPADTSLGGWFSALGVLACQLYVSGPGVPPTTNIRIGTETGSASFDCDLSDGLWHHIVGTLDGAANARLYLDGALVAGPNATAFPGGLSINPFKLATYGADGAQTSWPGGIDEFAVYSHELSAARVLAHFNAAQ